MTMAPIIGVDLGTTYCCVGIYWQGKVHIIPDGIDRTIPSWVSFSGSQRLIGAGAKAVSALNPKNTVYDAKRLIGKKMNDADFLKHLKDKNYPFDIHSNAKNSPTIRANYRGQETSFVPEQISGMLLTHMKTLAQNYTHEKIQKAVITVPAHFSDSQRQATFDAGIIAGLEVVALINEPNAAAIAYGMEKDIKESKNVLIFDFGGGTCDVSILNIKDGKFDVKATEGNGSLGGRDIDEILVSHCLDLFEKAENVKVSTKAVHRLREACEKAKLSLSSPSAFETTIVLGNFYGETELIRNLTRRKFNELCNELFQQSIKLIKLVMEKANFVQCDIDEVVMVGGTSYIPKVQQLVKEYFDWRNLVISVNPNEAVAYGAAVHAAVLAGDDTEDIKDILLMDVTPLSLGIEISGDLMSVVVEQNTPIPCQRKQKFVTSKDYQTSADIWVFQGERKIARDNIDLGKFTLTGLPPALRGISKLDVIFDIDKNSILTVTAVNKAGGNSEKMEIVANKGRLSDQEIHKMIEDAKMFEEHDKKRTEAIKIRLSFEQFLYDMKKSITKVPVGTFSTKEKESIKNFCDNELFWLDENLTADANQYIERRDAANRDLADYMARLKM